MILHRKRICLFIKHLYNNDLHNHKFNTLLQTNCSDIYVKNQNSNSTFFIIFRSIETCTKHDNLSRDK